MTESTEGSVGEQGTGSENPVEQPGQIQTSGPAHEVVQQTGGPLTPEGKPVSLEEGGEAASETEASDEAEETGEPVE